MTTPKTAVSRRPLSSFLLYRAFLSSGIATLLQRAATHLSGIFHGIFSTIEKDTTKLLGLRGIRVPEPSSRLKSNRRLMRMVEQYGGKFQRKKKIGFRRNQKIPSDSVIA